VTLSLTFRLCSLLLVAAAACDPGSSPPEAKKVEVSKACKSNEMWNGKQCIPKSEIKLNTVGYLVGRAKRATVPAVDGVQTFAVVSVDTDEVVFQGDLGVATENADTNDTTRIADFSSFDAEGTYVLKVEGVLPSPEFRVGYDVFNEPLRVAMLGLYGQRCGVAVEIVHRGDTFRHAACHLHDAMRDGQQVDGTGGWHDAGDYGKYTVNAAFALAFILKAWEDFGAGLDTLEHIPNRSGALPAWLDEAQFQMDQILKMQQSDGSVAHMIGPQAFPGMIAPEQDDTLRSFSGIGTAATADLAAVAAMASRVFRAYDGGYADKCLAAALAAETYLEQNAASALPDFSKFTHQAYSTQDNDDRFWALAELWRTTSDPGLLTRVEASLRSTITDNFDWSNVDNLGMFAYVQAASDARNPEKLATARSNIVASADRLVVGTATNAYGRGIDQMYYWGVNGVLARSTINLLIANTIAPDAKYLDAAVQQIDHLLGRNVFGRSYVTGLGYLPAMHPHHRPSEGDDVVAPWPGLLVGGPNPNNEPDKSAHAGLPKGLFWFDESGSYNTNEIAINWNAALAYALAGFYR
jgi:endoglucanase